MLAEMTGCQLTSFSEASNNTGEVTRTSQVAGNPFSSSWYRSCLENHQAKRARVENILQRMAGSPPVYLRDDRAAGHHHHTGADAWNGSEEDQSLLGLSQSRVDLSCGGDHKTGEAAEHPYVPHVRHQRDQTKQVYNTNSEEDYPESTALTGVAKHEAEECHRSHTLQIPDVAPLRNSPSDFWRRVKREGERHSSVVKTQSRHMALDTETELLDLLKSELSRAVNTSVDLVFEKMSHYVLKMSHQNPEESECVFVEENMKLEEDTAPKYSASSEITELSPPSMQTEALSLVIQKPPLQDSPNEVTQSFSDSNSPPSQSKQNTHLMDPEVLQRYQDSPSNALDSLSCRYNASPSSVDVASHSWEPIKVTSRGMSTCMSQQAQLMALSHLALDSFCLPHIKRENHGMAETSSFLPFNISFENVEEGLTPGHLKKAKLMFFYTRYPSSNVLKNFFPDVKVRTDTMVLS
ncbi:hypothetical protein ACEWY4_021642 [Coilia grayii]|uniref:Prospero domain-containing protein n=1 Tax=Coilia grayii TaxID=363190 RepID=A0ABD1J3X8_9TELE